MKRSKHWADTYRWVEKVIDSCTTPDQCTSALNLIDNWNRQCCKQNPNMDRWFRHDLYRKLIIKASK